jgi:rod shape-determining protein MreC
MARTWADISKRMLFAYFMLGGFIVLFLPTSWTGKLQLHYTDVFRVPLGLGPLARDVVRRSEDPLVQANKRLHETNQVLQNRCDNLEAQLEAAQKKIDRLAGVRTNSKLDAVGFLPADVVIDPTLGQNELIIGRGQDDGVKRGQYVVADLCVIGTISEVVANTSRVRLITDTRSKIPVQIGGTNVRGIMAGRGDGAAEITKVPSSQSSSIKTDSVVLASNIPEAPGVSIKAAVVTGCKPAKKPVVVDVSVRPACDVVNLTSVFVIVPRK